jgi:hypothetical protein
MAAFSHARGVAPLAMVHEDLGVVLHARDVDLGVVSECLEFEVVGERTLARIGENELFVRVFLAEPTAIPVDLGGLGIISYNSETGHALVDAEVDAVVLLLLLLRLALLVTSGCALGFLLQTIQVIHLTPFFLPMPTLTRLILLGFRASIVGLAACLVIVTRQGFIHALLVWVNWGGLVEICRGVYLIPSLPTVDIVLWLSVFIELLVLGFGL